MALLAFSARFTLPFLAASIAEAPPWLQLHSALTPTNHNLFAPVVWVDLAVLLEQSLVVIAPQPELVVGRSQYGLLKILAPLALDNQTRAVIVEALIVAGADTALPLAEPVGAFGLYESD
jgi:hypothetical protein